MQFSDQVESILQTLMNGTKEIRSYLFEVKTKVDCFIETLSFKEEEKENKLEKVPPSKLENILSLNALNFEVIAQSVTVNENFRH